MKRILLAVLALLYTGVAQAQQKTAELMGLGMSAELAAKLGEEQTAFRSNNTAVKMLDAAGTPVPVLKVDSSDDTILDAAPGDIVKIAVATTPEVEFISDKMTFTGNTGVIAAPTAVALAVGAVTELTVGNDAATFSGGTGVVAAATAVAISAAGANVATVNNRGIQFTSAGQGITRPVYVPTLAATPVAGTNIFQPGAINVVPTHAANTAGLLPPTPIVGDEFRIKNASGANIRVKAGGAATMNGATAGGYAVMATGTVLDCIATAADNYDCIVPVQPTPAGP